MSIKSKDITMLTLVNYSTRFKNYVRLTGPTKEHCIDVWDALVHVSCVTHLSYFILHS